MMTNPNQSIAPATVSPVNTDDADIQNLLTYNVKSLLNQFCQRMKLPQPMFSSKYSGPDHARSYVSYCIIEKDGLCNLSFQGEPGRNRKTADNLAAKVALDYLTEVKKEATGMNDQIPTLSSATSNNSMTLASSLPATTAADSLALVTSQNISLPQVTTQASSNSFSSAGSAGAMASFNPFASAMTNPNPSSSSSSSSSSPFIPSLPQARSALLLPSNTSQAARPRGDSFLSSGDLNITQLEAALSYSFSNAKVANLLLAPSKGSVKQTNYERLIWLGKPLVHSFERMNLVLENGAADPIVLDSLLQRYETLYTSIVEKLGLGWTSVEMDDKAKENHFFAIIGAVATDVKEMEPAMRVWRKIRIDSEDD